MVLNFVATLYSKNIDVNLIYCWCYFTTQNLKTITLPLNGFLKKLPQFIVKLRTVTSKCSTYTHFGCEENFA